MEKFSTSRVIAAGYFISSIIYLSFPDSVENIHWEPYPGVHVHHFVYGIIVLALACCFALYYDQKAKNYVALLYGFGLFLVSDEFSMWFRFKEVRPDAYRYLGYYIVIGIFLTGYLFNNIKNFIGVIKNHNRP